MWETEEYTNKDAIRDMIGVSFIFPDGTPLDEKQELMITAWALMPNFWYILRAKWEFWGIISDVAQWLNRRKKIQHLYHSNSEIPLILISITQAKVVSYHLIENQSEQSFSILKSQMQNGRKKMIKYINQNELLPCSCDDQNFQHQETVLIYSITELMKKECAN